MDPSEGGDVELSAPATIGDIKAVTTMVSSEMKELRELIMGLMQDKNHTSTTPTPTDVAQVVTPSKGDNNETAPKGADGTQTERVDDPTKPNADGSPMKAPENYHSVPHVYSPDPPIPHPHITHQGQPPPLTPKSFDNWQNKMKSYLCSSSIELWRIVEQGFKAVNPNNLTRRGVGDSQLNASALYMLQQAVGEKDLPHIEDLTTAKEAWDTLAEVFVGNASMRSNRYDGVSNEAEGFLMDENESHEDMYRRLKALATTFKNLGASHVDDAWVKRKYMKALMSFEPIDLKNIKGRHNFHEMTSSDVMQEMAAFKVDSKNAEDARARALGMKRGINLALKAKAMEYIEEDDDEDDDDDSHFDSSSENLKLAYNEHMAFHAKAFWREGRFKDKGN